MRGFHGTSGSCAKSIDSTKLFIIPKDKYERLGKAVYFFTYGLFDPQVLALAWGKEAARKRNEKFSGVIGAKIWQDETNTLNLNKIEHRRGLLYFAQGLSAKLALEKKAISWDKRNRNHKFFEDHYLFSHYCQAYEEYLVIIKDCCISSMPGACGHIDNCRIVAVREVALLSEIRIIKMEDVR